MRLLTTIFCLFLLLPAPVTLAQDEVEIRELTALDRQFMSQQRTLLDDIARRNLGRTFGGGKDSDIALLQTLLEKQLVRADQTQELQAMGVILGDHLAKELDMQWVIYEDKLGRSRALRLGQSDNYLFPMTMISRRREAGNTSSVADIYQKAYDIIAPLRTPLPFE